MKRPPCPACDNLIPGQRKLGKKETAQVLVGHMNIREVLILLF